MSKKTQYHFAVISKATFDHQEGATLSQLRISDLRLECSGNLDRSRYIDGKGLPRMDAMKPITATLVSGLLATINNCHAKGWWNAADHVAWIVEHLKEGLSSPSETGESTMEY